MPVGGVEYTNRTEDRLELQNYARTLENYKQMEGGVFISQDFDRNHPMRNYSSLISKTQMKKQIENKN